MWSQIEIRYSDLPTDFQRAYGCGSVPDSDRLSLELAVLVLLPEQGDRRET